MDGRGIERSSAMGTESLIRLILRFSVPGIVGMVANAFYNIVDRIFVGRAVDPMGIGAIAVGFPFMMLIIAFSTLIGVGAGSLVSISLGERRRSRAERAMGNALLLLTGGGVLATVVGRLFSEEILALSGVTPTLLPMAKEYLGIVVWGIPLSAIGFGLNYFIRAEGSPRFAMFGLVLGAVMNILLDALFIFAFRMGIGGAALATVLSQGITALWSAWYYLARMGELRFRLRTLIPSPDILRRIVAVGLAPFLTEMSFTFILILFNRLLRRYGGDMAVSAMGIFFSLDSLFFLPVMGLAGGVQPIIGYNFGARNYERVIRAVKIALVMAALFLGGSFLVVQMAPELLVRFFTTRDAELVRVTARWFRMAYACVAFASVNYVASHAFQAMGKAKIAIFMSLSRHLFFIFLPLLVLPPIFGTDGVWLSFSLSDVGGGLMGAWLLRREFRRLRAMGLEKGLSGPLQENDASFSRIIAEERGLPEDDGHPALKS